MNEENDNVKIIDWTDRKEAMETYRKYEKIGATGPCYQYYAGKLLPASPILVLGPEPVPYVAKDESEEGQISN